MLKFLLFFCSFVSASYGGDWYENTQLLSAEGFSKPKKEDVIYCEPFTQEFIERKKDKETVTIALAGQGLCDTLPIVGDSDCSLRIPLPSGQMFKPPHSIACDLQALKGYYFCLNLIAEQFLKFTIKRCGAVMDHRASSLDGWCNQTWFNGQIIIRVVAQKTQLEGEVTSKPFWVGFLGFDTPLGYQSVLSFNATDLLIYNSHLMDNFDVYLVKRGTDKKGAEEWIYRLNSIHIGSTKFIFSGKTPYLREDKYRKGDVYKAHPEFIIPKDVNKIYQHLKVPEPKPLHELFHISSPCIAEPIEAEVKAEGSREED